MRVHGLTMHALAAMLLCVLVPAAFGKLEWISMFV
jgi:hypothetical protein